MNTVSAGTVKALVGPSPYAVALDVLAASVGTDRKGAWLKVQPLIPEYSKDIQGFVKALTALTKARKYRPLKYLAKRELGLCRCCHRPLPHNTFRARSIHGHYAHCLKASKKRWVKYPDPRDRRAQTALARTTVLAARHQRWIAALLAADPLVTKHLLDSQGSEAVIARWRTLSFHRRKKLLKAVPLPPKRLYKGEILVRKGLRPPKVLKWFKDYSDGPRTAKQP